MGEELTLIRIRMLNKGYGKMVLLKIGFMADKSDSYKIIFD